MTETSTPRRPSASAISRLLGTAGHARAKLSGSSVMRPGFRVQATAYGVRVTYCSLLSTGTRERRLQMLDIYAKAIGKAEWPCEVDEQLVVLRVLPILAQAGPPR